MTFARPSDGGVGLARGLLLAIMVTVLLSTSLSIAIEFATYIAFMIAPELRTRLRHVFGHPVVAGALPFAALLALTVVYDPVPWGDGLRSLFAWRRILLLPLAAAVFTDENSKRLVLKVLVATCVMGALASFVTTAASLPITWRLGPAIVFRNYATQSLTLSLASIVCIATLLRPRAFARDRLLGNRAAMAAALVIMVIDVVFVLWSRTGYLALVVMSVTLVAYLVGATWRTKLLAGLAILACVAAVLATSAHVRERIAEALNDVATVDIAPVATQAGARVVMWRTTVRMIRDNPVLGVGTGGFQDGYRRYVEGVAGWQGTESGDPHNQFLKIQAEQGLIGLLAFLFFIYRALAFAAPAPWRQFAAAGLLGWCAVSLANSDFSTHVEGRLIFFWIGAMLGGGTSEGAKTKFVSARDPHRRDDIA